MSDMCRAIRIRSAPGFQRGLLYRSERTDWNAARSMARSVDRGRPAIRVHFSRANGLVIRRHYFAECPLRAAGIRPSNVMERSDRLIRFV